MHSDAAPNGEEEILVFRCEWLLACDTCNYGGKNKDQQKIEAKQHQLGSLLGPLQVI